MSTWRGPQLPEAVRVTLREFDARAFRLVARSISISECISVAIRSMHGNDESDCRSIPYAAFSPFLVLARLPSLFHLSHTSCQRGWIIAEERRSLVSRVLAFVPICLFRSTCSSTRFSVPLILCRLNFLCCSAAASCLIVSRVAVTAVLFTWRRNPLRWRVACSFAITISHFVASRRCGSFRNRALSARCISGGANSRVSRTLCLVRSR